MANLTALRDQAHAGLRADLARAASVNTDAVLALVAEMLRACVDYHEKAREVLTAGLEDADERIRATLYYSALEYSTLIAEACESAFAEGDRRGLS